MKKYIKIYFKKERKEKEITSSLLKLLNSHKLDVSLYPDLDEHKEKTVILLNRELDLE